MQLVGYETATAAPGSDAAASESDASNASADRAAALLIERDGRIRREPLVPGADLAYTLGERRCAGARDGERHLACDATDAPFCADHTSTWVCARCTGICLKDEMDCYEDHAVYLAAFAPATFKVGVTRAWRLETRLREQGADRAAHLHTVSNGRIAREIEADVADDIGDSVRVPTKIRGLGRRVDDDAWAALLAAHDPVDTFAFDYGLDLESRPVAETMATGTVRGTKGRILALDRGGTAYAVDMRDLVGYEVVEGASDADRQASLGAFG